VSRRDAKGQTPFMLAVSIRAYPAALILFDTIQKISKDRSSDVDIQKKVIKVDNIFIELHWILEY
jgi:hypothetical protein